MDLPPKRLSVEAHSPHYNLELGRKVVIALNGKPETLCVEYDQVEGWIRRYVIDETTGKLLTILGDVVIEKVIGVVSVRFK